ncbi:alpha/beta hydrolase [Pseudoalteromonas piscicida]|uniref:Alpha/beta hydrolase n=1 Tax=Pseudoalteromonas piscicida TaxID=43662 RepID=A0AAD0W2M4_PSEO7|nr:alpha/beta hydrolase [Pseudoalteromonas piscicida]ASD67983.1 alpha/beta hydrolase [Pseudoalteromonas piscicida]AXR01310.1 alpha/beta hydrolase [Pseudoalteromonas piscicida]
MVVQHKLLVTIFSCFLACILSACNNQSEQGKLQYTTHTFDSFEHQLEGRLYTPKSLAETDTIVILVHGDGAMDTTAKGYYLPIIQSLVSANIATFSWDKPGVGNSQGNWLSQSMDDRATEVKDAIRYLRNTGYQQNKIAVLGFSQASWVFSNLYDEENIEFMVLVGGAANWLAQSQYSMWVRLIEEEKISANDEAAIARIEQLSIKEMQLIKAGYDQYISAALHQDPFMPKPIEDEARYNFVRKNIEADVFEGFTRLNLPMLAIYGDSDFHVDIEHSQSEFARAFANSSQINAELEQITIADAAHSLMKPELPLDAIFSIKKNHFAPSAIETIVDWVKEQSGSSRE